jgi:hypothetical protein
VDCKILETVSEDAWSVNLTKFIACYFNSLLQMLYTIPNFVSTVLTADITIEEEKKGDDKNGSGNG